MGVLSNTIIAIATINTLCNIAFLLQDYPKFIVYQPLPNRLYNFFRVTWGRSSSSVNCVFGYSKVGKRIILRHSAKDASIFNQSISPGSIKNRYTLPESSL